MICYLLASLRVDLWTLIDQPTGDFEWQPHRLHNEAGMSRESEEINKLQEINK